MDDARLARQTLFIKRSSVKRDALPRRLLGGNSHRSVSGKNARPAATRGGITAASGKQQEANEPYRFEETSTTTLIAAVSVSALLVRPSGTARPPTSCPTKNPRSRAPKRTTPRPPRVPILFFFFTRNAKRFRVFGFFLGKSFFFLPFLFARGEKETRVLTRRDTPLFCCVVCLARSSQAAFPASAAVDHVVAQTAAFSGADALLRGALAVAAASGSYAIARRGSGTETAAELRETETLAVSEAQLETETEAQLETTRERLDAQSARSDALERENAALAAALDQATRDAEAARGGEESASRASSDAATARATELVESLRHQIEALRVEMDEERVTGGLKVEDASSRAEQLADQLQATQRTANKLAGELEAYRREAYDFDAKQALTNLQLKAAHEKVDALQEVVSEADAKAEARVREKASKIAELTKKVESLASDKAALETRLEETEQRLELEVAGSLAAAKKKAMAMLDSYDVTQMSGDGGDPAQGELAMREALGRRAEFPPPPGAGAFPAAQVPSPPAGSAGEWLQAYDVEREIHYWYNNITMETVWELPEGARVHDSVVDRAAGDDDLPKHFEGPSGLNSR